MKGLLLLSGGIDSPVAGRLMLDKGASLAAVHFGNELYAGKEPERKVRELARIIGINDIVIVDLSLQLGKIAKQCDHHKYFIIQKRLMYRVAERLAQQLGCSFLVTGESLAQVSSQTAQNLSVIDAAVGMPVLRPLIGFDKQEIIALAKKFGTYDASKGPETCDALGPRKPSTRAKLEVILDEEKKIDVAGMVEGALAAKMTVKA
jgi:thiamine biosynthesis protein ThiI